MYIHQTASHRKLGTKGGPCVVRRCRLSVSAHTVGLERYNRKKGRVLSRRIAILTVQYAIPSQIALCVCGSIARVYITVAAQGVHSKQHALSPRESYRRKKLGK
jgi:hypothetical protein